jgi:DNA mismatch repair protein MutS
MNFNELVPNTISLKKDQRFLLLTGPNMGGKSTLLRQTCLLAILAQIGSYVPAKSYKAIVFDQIFCRIGASDRLV